MSKLVDRVNDKRTPIKILEYCLEDANKDGIDEVIIFSVKNDQVFTYHSKMNVARVNLLLDVVKLGLIIEARDNT